MFSSTSSNPIWRRMLVALGAVFAGSAGMACGAELSLFAPLEYQVVQRSSTTRGELSIVGEIDGRLDDAAIFEVRISSDQDTGQWQKLDIRRDGPRFSTTMPCAAGGWYRLELRAVVGDSTVDECMVEHVGVGEVFVVAGQSNSANHGEVKQTTKSGRVAAFDGQRWRLADDPQPGASGRGGSFMPPLGDALAERLDVPIGFVACGIGATSVREWLPKGTTFPNPPTILSRVEHLADGTWASKGDAYAGFITRVKPFGPRGFRAVLWHQGESDANQKDASRTLAGTLYREYLEKIIEQSRREIGWPAPWFVAQVSYHVPGDEGSEDIRQAQAALWKDGIALQGPDSDALKGPLRERNGQGVHFSDHGLREHAARWAEKIVPWLEGQLASKEVPSQTKTKNKTKTKTISFNRDVRPFLSDTCFQCHGPDAKTREADLRLDIAESASADRGGYAAIVPGDPDASQAMQRILSDDPAKQMPPPGSGLKLTSEQKEIFRRWIAEGAVYQAHWAFRPIVRPPLPDGAKATHPIDAFVRSRLIEAGLAPSPPAAPDTQIRRVTLDLTGLPPSLAEIDDFLRDVERRGLDAAYASAVDRLLKSPRYGERMAWVWMEAARYADTDGYQNDGPRDMWRWRDWVIDAFTRSMPFDQFTIEQLAGDLLPNPTHEQLIATAFNRNNRYNSEEGIPIDEFLLENAVDRVDTTATVWMGLTAGCARCHDHKFDPLSQREYYQLIDYFNDVAESGRAIKFGNSEPWIKTPLDEQRKTLAEHDAAVELAEQRLAEADERLTAGQAAWEKTLVAAATSEPSGHSTASPLNPTQTKAALAYGLDEYFSFDGDDDRVQGIEGAPKFDEGIQGRSAVVEKGHGLTVGKVPGLIGNGRFSIAFWMKPGDARNGPVLSNEAKGTGRNGILVEFIDGRLRWNINTRWISGVSTVETRQAFRTDQWVHIALTNDGTQRADGMLIYVNGRLQPVNVIRNTNSNAAGREQGEAMKIGYSKHVGWWNGCVDELRFYTRRTLSADEIELLAVEQTLPVIAAIAPSARTSVQSQLLRVAYLEQAAAEEYARLWQARNEAIAARTAYWDGLPTTMIMRDLLEPRPSYVRLRGVYNALGEKVEQGVPAVLPPLSADATNNRLAFARWLVSGQHPLTARVTVNRFWQMLFGVGLVRTTEDFGSQGELPSHPELLDWLAAEFMEQGWDVKCILKTIVTSQTYRQSSFVSPDLARIDPENRLLARAPRLRLPGNVIRDQALYVSGLLVEKQGGPSVFPYQPDRLWEEASNAKYKVGKGEELYRRSLYTYWKRTLAPPTMAVLDTADRESCSVRPKLTNTPLQALTLMNDVTFVEAARKFAERILGQRGLSKEDRIDFAFRTVTARHPTADESAILCQAWDKYRAEIELVSKQAEAIRHVGQSQASPEFDAVDLAAATALANVLLNLEEVTTRE